MYPQIVHDECDEINCDERVMFLVYLFVYRSLIPCYFKASQPQF